VCFGDALDMGLPIFFGESKWQHYKVMDKRGRTGAAKPPGKPPAEPPADPMSRKQQVQLLLSKMDASLEQKAGKASVADFIRLTQLERELEKNEPVRKVVITWKESPGIQLIET
jgi:hypothetical protein